METYKFERLKKQAKECLPGLFCDATSRAFPLEPRRRESQRLKACGSALFNFSQIQKGENP